MRFIEDFSLFIKQRYCILLNTENKNRKVARTKKKSNVFIKICSVCW